MSEEQRNKQIMIDAYKLWHESKGASVDHWMGILSDKVKFKSLADGAEKLEFTSRIKSRADMKHYFSGLSKDMEMLHYSIDHIIAEGDKVVVVGRTGWRVKANGQEFDTPKCDFVRFEDGRIVSFYEFYDTAMVLNAIAAGA